jgi:long-chain acyl-CoA synthetase
MLVHEFLKRSACLYPQKTALIFGAQCLSYEKIDEMSSRLASALIEGGLKTGERVAIVTPNSPETVIALFGVLKAGGVFFIIHPSVKAKKLSTIIKNAGARIIILAGDQIPGYRTVIDTSETLHCMIVCDDGETVLPEYRIPAFLWNSVMKHFPRLENSPKVCEQDLACIIYTSGSSGEPKGVMESHSCVDFATMSIIRYLENTQNDIILNCLPLSFDYGLYQVLMVFKFGGTIVLEPSFTFPTAILRRIEEEGVTGFPGVPTIFLLFLRMDLSKFDLSSLRYMTNTAAALPAASIERLTARFPHVLFYSMYGLTECKRALYLPPAALKSHTGSVGIPIPETEAWIQGPAGERLPAGITGELVVRGRHVMKGYFNNPEETARTFGAGRSPEEGVLFTGDLFFQDKDGYFYFISRIDDIIKTRGEKVAPKEIENVLYLLPSIAEAAIVGVPDPFEGEAIRAYIVPSDPSLSEKEVLDHCKKHLEPFMIPKWIEFRNSLPKNPSEKIIKREIV